MPAAVTVIVVNFNGGALLGECLAALQRQDMAAFEAIVVDNASTDGSDALVEPFLADPRFRLLRAPGNLGFAAANNLAIAGLDAEWIATLNPDAIAAPDWLAELLAATQRHPGVDMFGSTQWMAPGVLDGAGDAYHALGFAWRGGHGQAAAAPPPDGETFSPCAAAALYRRAAVLAVGGFDERYFCYCEDVDLAFRLRLTGSRCVQIGRAQVRHVGAATGGNDPAFRHYHGWRNSLWTFAKNMPAALFWPLLPCHLLLHLYLAVRARPASLRPVALRALRDGLRGLAAIWPERRRVQAMRRIGLGPLARLLVWSPRALRQRPIIRLS